MTIFDSIRYPISDLPTEEELAAIPRRIYYRWIKKMWKYKLSQCPPSLVAEWASNRRDMPTTTEALSVLRKLIQEYEPNDNLR